MTAVEEEVFDFASGVSVGEDYKKMEDSARAAARKSTKFFSLPDDGDKAILRFLFEANQMGVDRSRPIGPDNPYDPATGWIVTKQHSFVATKPAPPDKPAEAKWSETVGAICRRTPKGDNSPMFPDCYICDNIKNERGQKEIATVQLWATACLREVVLGTQEMVDMGRIAQSQIGQQVILDQVDLIDEVDDTGTPTGKKKWQKRIVIVNMAQTNFFSPLKTAAEFRGTILDRDYLIERKGAKKARRVDYTPQALDPYQVTVMRNGVPTTITYDLREPEIAALYLDSTNDRAAMLKQVSRRVSKAYYDKWFDTRVETRWNDYKNDDDVATKGSTHATGPDAPPPPATPAPTPQQQAGQVVTAEPTAGPSADALAAMRQQVLGTAAPAAAAPVEAPPVVAAAAPPLAAPLLPQ